MAPFPRALFRSRSVSNRAELRRNSSASLLAASLLGMAGGFAAVLACPSPAFGQAVDAGDGEDYAAPPTERRGGFMASLSYDVGYGLIGGYPNRLGQLNNPRFYEEVSGLGAGFGLVLGGALRDWLTAGLLVRVGGVQRLDEDSIVAGSNAIGLRLEGYPLYPRGGAWRDLSLAGEFGVGLGSVVDLEGSDDDAEVLADGGAMSHLALAAGYSPWRFWHFSAGPELRYTYQYSQSMTAHVATAGMRLTFFGVQPGK